MKLFSNIFKSKPKKTFESHLGTFTLVYSKRTKFLWQDEINGLSVTVRGSENEPDSEHLNFFENVNEEVLKLNEKITKKFIREFKEADIEVNFNFWRDRFKIVGMELMLIFQRENYWNITFQDLREPYAHFTLFIEGERLTDFSIDT